jgi:protein phosphatase 1 regulatory subunit 7
VIYSSLDCSFNELRVVDPPLEGFPQLAELYLVNNKLTRIRGLEHLPALRCLELGSNRLREIENLESLSGSLEQLWLGRNKITTIQVLCNLLSRCASR